MQPRLRPDQPINLGTSLERELGLDSLGRAELVLRLDRAFKVRLPNQIVGEAETLRDLLKAVRTAGPARDALSAYSRIPAAPLPAIEVPSSAETLIDALAFHAREHPDRPHLRVWIDEQHQDQITYCDLQNAACRVAYGFVECGIQPGDCVAIMLPTSLDFFRAYFGAQCAGGIPVPIYPPLRRSQIEDHLRRQARILTNAQAKFLIVADELRNVGSLLFGLVDSLQHIKTVSDLDKGHELGTPVAASAQTVALIQYTSGSTGDPKGVVLTHANILANIRAMGAALNAGPSDVFVSWLPLYHDMGLIGAWLGSLYYGALAIVMPPLAFLADPARWLRAISDNRATLSASPNFGFELSAKNIRDDDIAGLNLGSLRLVVNGSEPVSPVTIERFTKRFAPYGFRPEMMGPVYGLAENSVGLAFPPLGRAPIVEKIRRSELASEGRAILAEPDDRSALSFVACGQPLPGHEIRIVDGANREVSDRVEGRLQFRGPSATSGYFRNDDKTRELFCEGWLESGDRAYLANGDVFVTGRIKDMIIKAGRNIYPHEIEDLIGEIEGARKGCVAAIAVPHERTGTEQLVLIVETRLTEPVDREQLHQRVIAACIDLLASPPDIVELVPPHTVPKTSSGKIRRSAMRALYEAGLPTGQGRTLRLQLFMLALSGAGTRIRRILQRIGELAYAGYWWSTLVLMASLVWPTVLLLPRRTWRHAVVRHAARWFLKLSGAMPRISGQTSLPLRDVVLVANHSSYMDALVICALVPGTLTFVAKQELAGQMIAGPFLRRLGAVFARRTAPAGGTEDTERQLEAAQAGERIVSFPEGTLTRMPGLLQFRLGAFQVAARAGLQVIPITIRGTRSALRGGQWFARRSQIHVQFGAPHTPRGSDFSAAVALRDEVRADMLKHCGEPDLARERIEIRPA